MKISNQTIPIEFNIIILVNEQGVDMGERRIIRAESYNLPSKDTRAILHATSQKLKITPCDQLYDGADDLTLKK